jgi:hypothetical protein
MPETEAIKRKVLAGELREELDRTLQAGSVQIDVDALMKVWERASAPYFEKFREAWTQKQDTVHQDFFDSWLRWVEPIVSVSRDDFSFRYPTAGASEGLRAMIDEYGARARRDQFEPEVHVFDGEYEGFSAYAEAAYIPVSKHDRGSWQQAVREIATASKSKPVQVYLSQPSAIDGNVWNDCDRFMTEIANIGPGVEVVLDLTYVGCIAKETRIRTDHPNIVAVVLSLSKPIGVYYDRIGGVLAKSRAGNEPYPSLFGNKWFKNLTSLAIGTEFMSTYHVYEMPTKYSPVQRRALEQVCANLSQQGHEINLQPSDVFLLGTGEMPTHPKDIHRYLERRSDGRHIVRLCLTPTMAEIIGMAKTHEVSPRYYESIGR